MGALIQWLIFGHQHKWKIVKQGRWSMTWGGDEVGYGDSYTLQCETCGRMSYFKAE